MSAKFNKNNKSWHVGIVPQQLYDDVEDLKEETFRGSVSVTADGVKTRAQVLDSLHALADISKVTINSKIKISSDIHTLCSISGSTMRFSSNISMDSTQSTTSHILFRASNSENIRCICNNGSTNTINNISSTTFSSGTKITLYY